MENTRKHQTSTYPITMNIKLESNNMNRVEILKWSMSVFLNSKCLKESNK